MQLAAGSVLAYRYRLEAPLGRGGAASAYLARDLVEQEEVAVKLLARVRPLAELRREFERLRGLAHPHLLRVRDFAVVTHEGERRALYSADYVSGAQLGRARQSLGREALTRIAGDVLDGLHFLHQLGLRHGDLKPDNVLLDAAGRAVLIDLGCATPLGQACPALSGTRGYLAPELLRGEPADERADLFALGAMLRELDATHALAPLIERLTAARAEQRPASAREVLGLLGDSRDVETSTRGRASRTIGRVRELEQARSGLALALRGEPGPRTIWLEGPPGVGRSRLLRELCFLLATDEVELLEASARSETPVRAALARRYGELGAGYEALIEQLQVASRAPSVLVLDDAQALAPDAASELAQALRSLPDRGRCAALVASTEPPPELATVLRVRLGGLAEAELEAWTEGRLSTQAVRALACATGGYPRYVERMLGAWSSGRLEPAELVVPDELSLPDREAEHTLAPQLRGLEESDLRLLAELAVQGRTERTPSRRLLERDLVTPSSEGARLTRDADREPLLRRLDPALVRTLALEAGRALAGASSPRELAAAIEQLARAGEHAQALSLWERERGVARMHPRLFVRALGRLASELTGARCVAYAELLRLSGAAPRALSMLARARRGRADGALFREAAEVYLALGRPRRARLMLGRAAGLEQGELFARVLVREGAYPRAVEVASAALAEASSTAERARLCEVLALALSYLGEAEAAGQRVAEALALHPPEDERSRARCRALSGFVRLRAGAVAEAADAYAEALALADRAGLADLALNACVNLASARQSLGEWGRALTSYERAHRLARALGRGASVHTARANLANLALEIGHFERARSELESLSEAGASAALALSTTLYRAELALLTGAPEAARERLRALLDASDTPLRERLEARALALQAAVAARDEASIRSALSDLTREGEPSTLDLLARVVEAEGAALIALAEPRRAVERLERALARTRAEAGPALTARLHATLSEACRRLQLDALAREHGERARALWERISLDLPRTLREAFWAHPQRARLGSEPRAPSDAGRATLSLSRIRELNRRIGGIHRREEVLEFALEAALELTCAERGFVLLWAGASRRCEVAAAVHMEPTRMRKSDWRFSRSVAEKVIREGEPVVTVDVGEDPRFAKQASVHAMQLKSVLCAPIRGQSSILGALYVDNRLQKARFSAEDAELLLAFADQVAIALQHAALVEALEHKARELAREKRKVEALLRGQAVELERISNELSAHRAALGARYEYTEIVGRSEPMRRVLSVLDRVIETDLSVLVQGESGTGKELVARAIHANSQRKEGPFVGINCAAVPELLLESELFGHTKGAFTGAVAAREGLFVTASAGTLFLDELGELPLPMQAKLLRALNDREVRPIGATKSIPVDIRLVCATNRNLRQRVAEGLFREDLYYRVSVVELTLPPLRERHEDIVPIAEALLRRRAEELGESPRKLSADAVRALLTHPWPGNVRELQNILLRATVMASGAEITREDLGLHARYVPTKRAVTSRREYAQKEAERLLSALESERWNVSKVAKNLGIPRNTLYRKLARYGIQRSGEP